MVDECHTFQAMTAGEELAGTMAMGLQLQEAETVAEDPFVLSEASQTEQNDTASCKMSQLSSNAHLMEPFVPLSHSR